MIEELPSIWITIVVQQRTSDQYKARELTKSLGPYTLIQFKQVAKWWIDYFSLGTNGGPMCK